MGPRKLQAVQNSAACVVTGTRKFDNITLVLCDLYWLPIRQRSFFYKCTHYYYYSSIAKIA